MKLATSREDLLTRLQTVARVAATHTAIQALSGTQILAAEGHTELRAKEREAVA